MSDELDEDDITSAIMAILHGTDQGKDEWSYNPAWFSADDKSKNNNTTTPGAAGKGMKAVSGDATSLAPIPPPPPVAKKLPPTQLPNLAQAPNMPPARAPKEVPNKPPLVPPKEAPLNKPPPKEAPLNKPPVVPPKEAPLNKPPVVPPKEAPLNKPPPKEAPLNKPPVVPPKEAPLNKPPVVLPKEAPPNKPPVVLPKEAPPNKPPVVPPKEVPLNIPPAIPPPPDDKAPVRPPHRKKASSNKPPVNLPREQAPPTDIQAVNSPPVQLHAPPEMPPPPVTSPLVQAPPSIPPTQAPTSIPPTQAPNITPTNIPPVQAPTDIPLTQAPPNVPPVHSPPLQAPPNLPPTQAPPNINSSDQAPPNIPPTPPPNTPPSRDSYCPAGTFNKFSTTPNYAPQSGYSPMGPAGGVSQQSTTNIIVVGGPVAAAPVVSDFNLTNYLRNPTKYISTEDYEDAYRGAAESILDARKKSLFHTITCHKFEKYEYTSAITFNIIRLCYFIFQFIYPIIVAIVTKGPVAFNVVCSLFAFAGLFYDCSQIYLKFKKIRAKKANGKKKGEENGSDEPETIGAVNPQHLPDASDIMGHATRGDTNALLAAATGVQKSDKSSPSTEKNTSIRKKMLKDFVQDMLEEIIIYPSLICNLYSFINEKGWEFNKAFDGLDFVLTFISFVLDAVWAKISHIWLLYKLIDNTIKIQRKNKIFSYYTPVNLLIPYSIGLAIAHTLMLMLIAIRIYADNFNTKDREKEPKEGDYSVAPYTRYMIFCGAYLPLMSGACYIILNKHWFLQISWILYNDKDAAQKMHYLNITSMPTRVKLFGFLRDKYAYIAVATFAPLFIAFYTGGFLQDYQEEDLPKGAYDAARTICTLFVLVFSIINFQAGIIFSIIIILLMMIFCVICTGGGSSRDVRKNIIR